MEQRQINRMEWENPLNWSGPRWLGIYSSKRDTRTWVPKRIPTMGWTVNLGRRAGVVWLAGILAGIPLLIILITVITNSRG